MSKTTRKKSAKKPKSAAKAAAPDVALPTELEEMDHLALKNVVLERNNAQLMVQNLQQQVQQATSNLQEAQGNFENAVTALNKKYALDPAKDKIDIGTGAITRGE